MRRYNNIPEAIRKGIFCFMAGSMVFLANETVAEAKEGDDNSSSEAESDKSEVNTPSEDAASEAADLIDLPEEPTTTESETQETDTGTITETENTYVEQTDNAVAVTEETIVEVVNDTESLTKDEETATTTTETTETTNDDGTVTTTEITTTTGEYVEDVSSTETNSVTDIATSDQNLAEEVVAQVEEAEKHNTENEGIELVDVSEHSFIDNGQEGQDPVALSNDQAAELANVSDGAEIVVETTNGTSNVSIDGQDVQLSEDLTNIIVDSAKDNVVDQSTTYSIGDTQVSEEDLSSLSQDVKDGNTEFTVNTDNNGTSVTYNDAEGKPHYVEDENLQNIISNAAETVSEKTETQTLEVLDKEFEGDNDPELAKEKEELEKIGYTEFETADGTGTYKTGEILEENFKTQEAADERKAELDNDSANYANARAYESEKTYVADTHDETYDSPEDAASAESDLKEKGYTNFHVEKNVAASEAEAQNVKEYLESEGFENVVINNNDGVYTISATATYESEETANQKKAELDGAGYTVNISSTLVDTQSFSQTYDNAQEATNKYNQLSEDGYTNLKHEVIESVSAQEKAEAAKTDLEENGFGNVKITNNNNGTCTIEAEATFADENTADQMVDALKDNYTVQKNEEIVKTGDYSSGIFATRDLAEAAAANLDPNVYRNVEVVGVTTTTEGTGITEFGEFAVTTKAKYDYIINNCEQIEGENGETIYLEIKDDGTKVYYKVSTDTEKYTILAGSGYMYNHQEGANVIGGVHTAEGYSFSSFWNPGTPYPLDVDFDAFEAERDRILEKAKTSGIILSNEDVEGGDPKYTISEAGTYYIDYIDEFEQHMAYVYVATDEPVEIVLRSDTGVVYLPIATYRSTYQAVERTDNDNEDTYGEKIPINVTFVTSKYDNKPDDIVKMKSNNFIGNLLATGSTVSTGGGNFCGTIVCKRIENSWSTEGHKYKYGYTAYLVKSRTEEPSGYKVVADTVTKNYKVSVKKDVEDSYQATVSGTLYVYKPKLDVSKEVNKQRLTAEKLEKYWEVSADTIAKKKILIAKRDVTTTIKKATLTKTEYSKAKTSLDKTYAIKISRYSKKSERGTWTEITTKVIPPETPETPPETPETPPETPETPPETPETPPETPETPPETPETPPETPETPPETPETPPETPETPPEIPETPDTPTTPEVPTSPDVPTTFVVAPPTVPDVPVTPVVPAIPDVPVTPDVPTIPDVPVTPDVPTIPDVPVTPDVPTIPDVPTTTPDTPVNPDVVPTPDENPTVPVIIIDDDTPLAAEVAQVLGARRVSAAQPMVLGARRGKTGDSTSNPLMATLMIMGASATAMGVLSSKKKRK